MRTCPSVVQKMQPQLGELAGKALEMVASIAGTVLLFMFSFIIAGIMMAFGESGAAACAPSSGASWASGRGEEFATLSTATIRAVAMGVLGVAFIQAIVVGIVMIIASVPFAGVLAMVVLVLGVAQVPALLVTMPVIAYIWMSGDYGTVPAVIYSVLLFIAGMLDNVLKPLLLGRGVDAPMPVVLLGALGGLAGAGILGMFVGATVLSLGYQILMWWVATNPDAPASERSRGPTPEPVPAAMPATRPGMRTVALAGAVLLGGCTTVGPDFERPARALAGRLEGRLARNPGRRSAATARRAAAAVVAQLQRPRARPADRRGAARQPQRADAGLRIMEARAQLGIAGSTRYPQVQQATGELLGVGEQGDRRATAARWPSARGCASAGNSTSGASSGAASRPRTPATWPASPSTTTCRC